MYKVLIAHSSEDLISSTELDLRGKYEIMSCSDGNRALELMKHFRPDAMVLHLSIPQGDGLILLEEAQEFLPPVILATTFFPGAYPLQQAKDLGVDHCLLLPCRQGAIAFHIARLLSSAGQKHCWPDPQAKVAEHLKILKIPVHLDGYLQLRIGIPLYAQDPGQRLSKELYPAIAEVCGVVNGEAVEHSIRSVLVQAWAQRDFSVWAEYFPDITDDKKGCPSNKVFISTLAQRL